MKDKTKGILICLLSGIVFITVFAIGLNLEPEWLSYLLLFLGVSISPPLTRSAIKRYLDEDSFVGWSYTGMAIILGFFIVYIAI